ncbi:MAG: NAD(P)H-hydrate dehydratase [Thermoplasmata archaeon]
MWPPGVRPLTSVESSVAEENAVALGITLDTLMENAGRTIAEEVAHRVPSPPAPVAIIAGTGNNGGDGFAAAYYLSQWGYAPQVWIIRPPSEIRSRPARRCFERVERRGAVRRGIPSASELSGMAIVVDALLGTGQTGPLRPPYREAVEAIRASSAPVLSIDVPSGLGGNDGLVPRWTVALTVPKEGTDATHAGEVLVRDIGIPPESWSRTGPGEFVFYRPLSTRRGRSGRIVVIGGGPYAGAPALAAIAALRSGAERATVIAPNPAAISIQSFSPNLVVRAIGERVFRPGDASAILSLVHEANPRAVVTGMGAGREPETVAALAEVIRGLPSDLPIVVDADALGALPPTVPSGRTVVATPNAGEYARAFGGVPGALLSDEATEVREIARQRGVLLVVKGEPDVISDGEVLFQNYHHHVAQTVSGVGDILAGTIASLLAQGLRPVHAARLATFWVGDAGIRGAGRRGSGLVATDLLEELPTALVAGLDRIARLL